MKSAAALLLALLLPFTAQAGAIGEWTAYLSYHNSTQVLPTQQYIYASFGGNLLRYDTEAGTYTLLSSEGTLHGRSIQKMDYSRELDCIVIVYSDLMIDLLRPDGTICGLSYLKSSSASTTLVNSLFVDGDYAVLGMPDGVVLLNLRKETLQGYYRLGKFISAAAIHDGVLYAMQPSRLYACPLSGNPDAPDNWKPLYWTLIDKFVSFGGDFFVISPYAPTAELGGGFWKLNKETGKFDLVKATYYSRVFVGKNHLILANQTQTAVYEQTVSDSSEHAIASPEAWATIAIDNDGKYWLAKGYEGLCSYTLDADTLCAAGDTIGGYGPRRDLCNYLRMEGGRLLVAGGVNDFYNRTMNAGTLLMYEDGVWSSIEEEGISEQTGYPFVNLTSVAQDPRDPSHLFAGSGNYGLYEFRAGRLENFYNHENSPLRIATGYTNSLYLRTDGLVYDNDNNLWIMNMYNDTIIRILTPDGEWKKIYVEGINMARVIEKSLFDRSGRLWLSSQKWHGNSLPGFLCLDWNGTIDNDADDTSTFRSSVTNQDGRSYSFSATYALAEDDNGWVWLGSPEGVFVVTEPEKWHDTDFQITQIKIPRNDGTNYADYLLDGVPVTAIAVDGANRKWIGTDGSGVYLVSADGTATLEHFTTENSPILADKILSIAPDTETGEIFIGTENGLCAYQSEATRPEETLDKAKLHVYPNPVRRADSGVNITGLTEDAEIKIATIGGQIVATGRSIGGSFQWNCLSQSGHRVASGVYYILVATSDGRQAIAGKLAVVH